MKPKMPPHLFPRLIITLSFPAHLPLPPPRPEWHSGKHGGLWSVQNSFSLPLFHPHAFLLLQRGPSQVLQSFRKHSVLSCGLCGLQGTTCSTMISLIQSLEHLRCLLLLSPRCLRAVLALFTYNT